MDNDARSQRSSVGSVIIVILLLVTGLFSIAAYSPTGLIAVPPVAADDAAATNDTALTTTTTPSQPTNTSAAKSSIFTYGNSTQSAVGNSTSMFNNSTISGPASMSNSSTISNSTLVDTSVISTQTSTAFSASANSSTIGDMISNATTTVETSSTTGNSTTLTNSTTTVVFTSTNTTIADTSVSETTSTSHVQSSFRVDRWDWSTWNTMNGLALWITNTGTEPLDIFSLSITIDSVPAGSSLYPGPSQPCPLNPISPQSECLFISTPGINPMRGNSYNVVIMSSDGAQTSFSATYGGRSNDPHQFTIENVSWTSTCCDYVLDVQIMNTGGTSLDTDQMAALVTLNGESPEAHSACGSTAPGMECHLTFHVSTLTSYVIVVIDPGTGDQLYLITSGW